MKMNALFDQTMASLERSLNLRAMNLVDTGAFGQLRLLVSDIPKTRRVLMKMHMQVYELNDGTEVSVRKGEKDGKHGQLWKLVVMKK